MWWTRPRAPRRPPSPTAGGAPAPARRRAVGSTAGRSVPVPPSPCTGRYSSRSAVAWGDAPPPDTRSPPEAYFPIGRGHAKKIHRASDTGARGKPAGRMPRPGGRERARAAGSVAGGTPGRRYGRRGRCPRTPGRRGATRGYGGAPGTARPGRRTKNRRGRRGMTAGRAERSVRRPGAARGRVTGDARRRRYGGSATDREVVLPTGRGVRRPALAPAAIAGRGSGIEA